MGVLFEVNSSKEERTECLGQTFESDEARRTYFLNELRGRLDELESKLGGVPFKSADDALARLKSIERWPMGEEEHLKETVRRMMRAARHEPNKDLLQLWIDEVGFPHGKTEDILRLSDPPYYIACPNPFIQDFLRCYGKPYDPQSDDYRREPFAADVSEGKNDPIYNAHPYHTKVPHRAIMRYILHYTEPGDMVFDGFCGTGMTGVAAQLCGNRNAVEALGYRVEEDGTILKPEEEGERVVWKPFSKLGARRAILNDLCPAATFIAYNYNTPVDVESFKREAQRVLDEVEAECGWMYLTLHEPTEEQVQKALAEIDTLPVRKRGSRDLPWGRINYTVWSDVFICPSCTGELVFWEAAVDKKEGKVRDEFFCPHCGARLTKRTAPRVWVTRFDKAVGQAVRQAKQVPVLINYSMGGRRFEKRPDAFDQALIEKIESSDIPYWFPDYPMMFKGMEWGDTWRAGIHAGLTHVHHFYTKRNLWVLATSYASALQSSCSDLQKKLVFLVQYACLGFAKICRYVPTHYSQVNQYLSGTLYVGSQQVEVSPGYILSGKAGRLANRELPRITASGSYTLETRDTGHAVIPSCSIDYIFTDPPFGGNLMYSELNFLWEAWLKVFTNNKQEAVENQTQGKGLREYQEMMTRCFREYYRVLKPGRWMTVVFHNSKNSIWNAIQEAIQEAGFVIADVRILDKQQGTFKQVTSSSAVKVDLVISAYKPNGGLEDRFRLKAGTEEGVWEFVRAHLRQLPVPGLKGGRLEVLQERMAHMLYDRMIAFHVRHGVLVPISAGDFYAGLVQRFPERDDMYFLPDQVVEYDKRCLQAKEVVKPGLFIEDEASAIQWLKMELSKKPQTLQEIHPRFTPGTRGWQKHEKPLELRDLLAQNFLCYDGKGPIPVQIVSWLKRSDRFRDKVRALEAAGHLTAVGLETDDAELIAASKDRWYVPDPNKAADLERLREKALLKEFDEYRNFAGRKMKVFRLEAVRVGFKKAWQERDYRTIIDVACKIPESVLQEDPKLLMWYDQALTRVGE